MKMNVLTNAQSLADPELLGRLATLALHEREATAELLAHLAVLDARPSAYRAAGYGSLFRYCTEALRFSEDAACSRIEAARACRLFPPILDLIASGEVTLTAVRRLGKYLTPENHQAILQRARHATRETIDALVAELDPQPDVRSLVRRLPSALPAVAAPAPPAPMSPPTLPGESTTLVSFPSVRGGSEAPVLPAPTLSLSPSSPRPVVQPTSPGRYRVQFTIGEATHEKLRRLQALLRREIPDGDPGAIFDRAVSLLLDQVETAKLGAARKPGKARPIRSGTDMTDKRPPRSPARPVKRAVWARDGGQCAFVSRHGRRCTERTFLEYHHVIPYARGGPATIDKIELRCRAHNVYEAELIFGPHGTSRVREPGPAFGVGVLDP